MSRAIPPCPVPAAITREEAVAAQGWIHEAVPEPFYRQVARMLYPLAVAGGGEEAEKVRSRAWPENVSAREVATYLQAEVEQRYDMKLVFSLDKEGNLFAVVRPRQTGLFADFTLYHAPVGFADQLDEELRYAFISVVSMLSYSAGIPTYDYPGDMLVEWLEEGLGSLDPEQDREELEGHADRLEKVSRAMENIPFVSWAEIDLDHVERLILHLRRKLTCKADLALLIEIERGIEIVKSGFMLSDTVILNEERNESDNLPINELFLFCLDDPSVCVFSEASKDTVDVYYNGTGVEDPYLEFICEFDDTESLLTSLKTMRKTIASLDEVIIFIENIVDIATMYA